MSYKLFRFLERTVAGIFPTDDSLSYNGDVGGDALLCTIPLTYQAFAAQLSHHLHGYKQKLCALEKHVLSQGKISLSCFKKIIKWLNLSFSV